MVNHRIDLRRWLKQAFLAEARVLDARLGYVSASGFNLRMKTEILHAAAALIADNYSGDRVEVIHGIPHSGNYLATAVALKLGNGIRLHASRKDQFIPVSWKEVYRQEVRSFDGSGEGASIYGGINLSFVRPGERVLLVDDICAMGETGVRITRGLKQRGVAVVGFAVMFDKVYQGGLERIEQLGVKTFSCVRVKEITPAGEIRLAG